MPHCWFGARTPHVCDTKQWPITINLAPKPKAESTSEQSPFARASKCLISSTIYMRLFSSGGHRMHGHRDAGASIDCRRQQCPLTSGAYNAEFSAPDQMTNITAETRPQSYLQLSRQRPSTQEQFSKLPFTVCVCVCDDCSMLPKPARPCSHTNDSSSRQQHISVSEVCALNRLIVAIKSTDSTQINHSNEFLHVQITILQIPTYLRLTCSSTLISRLKVLSHRNYFSPPVFVCVFKVGVQKVSPVQWESGPP